MKKRVISAVVLLAVTFLCVLLSTVSRVVYFGIIAVLCAYEWSKNLRVRDVYCADWVLYFMFVALTTVAVLGGGAFWYAAVLVASVMLSMTAGVVQKRVSGFGAMFTAAGVAYLGVLFAAILAISVSKIWLAAFALGCISTWVCDSCALFGGSRFGKHKLTSPGFFDPFRRVVHHQFEIIILIFNNNHEKIFTLSNCNYLRTCRYVAIRSARPSQSG